MVVSIARDRVRLAAEAGDVFVIAQAGDRGAETVAENPRGADLMGRGYQDHGSQEGAILAGQLGRQQTVPGKREFTGVVFCPQRMAGIAVMKCGEYQAMYGCHKIADDVRAAPRGRPDEGQVQGPPEADQPPPQRFGGSVRSPVADQAEPARTCPNAVPKKILAAVTKEQRAIIGPGTRLIDDGSDPYECVKCHHGFGNGQILYAGSLCGRCSGKGKVRPRRHGKRKRRRACGPYGPQKRRRPDVR